MNRPPGGGATAVLAVVCAAALTLLTAAGIWIGVRVLDAVLYLLSCLLNALP